MDVTAFNRQAWNRQVEGGNPWTIPVTSQQVAAARRGEWSLVLTPTIPVPRNWFPDDLTGKKILCLASGGGQQGPILAAAGAKVTVFDNSPAQLDQDRLVAERDGIEIETIQGDMANLSVFRDNSFDLIFHPVSNVFVPHVKPVWREAYRVLKPGGTMLSGFMNPLFYIFDFDVMENENRLEVRHKIPYSDVENLEPRRLQQFLKDGSPLEFGHSLDDQIGGQLEAGFLIAGFYEDSHPQEIISQYIACYIATRSIKMV